MVKDVYSNDEAGAAAMAHASVVVDDYYDDDFELVSHEFLITLPLNFTIYFDGDDEDIVAEYLLDHPAIIQMMKTLRDSGFDVEVDGESMDVDYIE